MTMIFLILFTHDDISHLLVKYIVPILSTRSYHVSGDLGMVPSGYVNSLRTGTWPIDMVSFPIKLWNIVDFPIEIAIEIVDLPHSTW